MALNRHSKTVSAEPALTVPGVDPNHSQVFPQRKGVRPKSSRRGRARPCSKPNDWSLVLTNVLSAWRIPPPAGGKQFGEGILVGHPDTGYTNHPEITSKGQILKRRGFDFEDNKSDPRDPLVGSAPGHGTSTASVIMSPWGGDIGGRDKFVSGTAPKAQLIPLRVSTSVVHISFRKVAKAIRFAADSGCHVISMSLGGPFGPRYLERAIDYAIGKGVIVLAAAGNFWPFVVYPARFHQVVAVAACDCRRRIWSGSATGGTVDVTAPGESVWRARTRKTAVRFDVNRSSGTSYAVAATAGICSLWLAFHGRRKLIARYGAGSLAAVFQSLIKSNGVFTPRSWDKRKHGTGIVDAEALLSAKLPGVAPRAVAPKALGPLTRISAYFPGADRAALKQLLADVFGAKGGALRSLADEISFHLATNPSLRVDIAKAVKPAKLQGAKTRAKTKRKAPSTKSILKKNPQLMRNASASLRAGLKI